ncbi:MAG: S9 family peptidase, partial [Candidatus Marinimicrobia bacterium]|nr:S9 family peptidase [Candidatus Neomarinimicrobiota bacterium]
GKGLFITTDEGNKFLQLKYYDIKKNKFKVLTGAIPWDVREMTISKKRDKIAFITNENGISNLYTLDTKSKKYKAIKNLPVGQIYGMRFNPDGKRLGLVINTPQTPGDIYVQSLTKDMSLERWTYSEVGGLNTELLVVPELIQYDTFDKVDGKQRKIPAFYYKPKKGEGPFPVVISIHGGPESQYRPFFSSTIQYFVNELGIAVLAPNVRGSAGYGKSYVKLDNGYKREDSVKDIGKLLDWIAGQSELDADRVVVYGGSYGGYMVLSSMTHYNDKLVGGIDVVGISNFVSFLENTKEYRRDLRRAEYGDERIPEMRAFLTRISPVTNVGNISIPLLVVQGLNDPRVPVGESEQMVEAIRNNGSPVWYLLAKDEGHGFRKKINRDFYLNSVVLFLEEYLINNQIGLSPDH